MEKEIDLDDLIDDLKIIYYKLKENPEMIPQVKKEIAKPKENLSISERLDKVEEKIEIIGNKLDSLRRENE